MIEFKDALSKIRENIDRPETLETEIVGLAELVGRVLANDIQSAVDVPPNDNSAMDGYAIQLSSVKELPQALPISQRIPAGVFPKKLLPNTAARIFTGANIPEGADCVVIQENCEATESSVSILSGASFRANIRDQGQDIKIGQVLFQKGHRFRSKDLGLLASIGITQASVYRKLRVAIISTGDELIPPGQPLAPGQIYDSNRFFIEAACRENHCDLIQSIHIRDSFNETVNCLRQLSEQCDLIISCGGVSVGEEDHVKNAVAQTGSIDLWKIQIKPGKPIALGKILRKDKTPCAFLGLPGNPVSAFVTLHLFGKPIIAHMQHDNQFELKHYKDVVNFATSGKNKRCEFIRVKRGERGLEMFANQSSGVMTSVCWADALALVPENTALKPGDQVTIYPI